MSLKHHGSGLADLENAVEYNFFTVKVLVLLLFLIHRKNPDLVAALDKLYAIIAKYVPESINIHISKIF